MFQFGKISSKKDEKEINPQSDGKQSDEKLKALFVGKTDQDEYGDKFQTLMGQLSIKHEEAQSKQKQALGLVTCTNYDYYNDRHEYTKEEYPTILKDRRLPREWVSDMRDGCIEIANHALELSGYAKYLRKKAKDFTDAGYNICCSINYYHNRTENNVGMHQDSLGIELFVLLIYLPTVEGPEVKLKSESQFNERIQAISDRKLMPKFFIEDVKGLYEGIKANKDSLIEWDECPPEFRKRFSEGKIEWIETVPGPGGIVGFVDELMIHSTPLEGRRASNITLLLRILGEMKTKYNGKDKELRTVSFLETAIQKINAKKEEEKYYISIDELKNIIDEQDEEILNELYKRAGEEQKSFLLQEGENGDPLAFSEHTLYRTDYTDETADVSEEYTGGRERRKSIIIQQKAKEGTEKEHEEVEGTAKEPKKVRRSFLRVWVAALPKKKD
ncbi:MAG: hypothetical protein BGO68_00305 [Candidatus Amoebophilus sp. 36-38]|nr:MAG: hypothetical protein BGO68_00305 [Candidatus Amoebophilus sp. 36-38]